MAGSAAAVRSPPDARRLRTAAAARGRRRALRPAAAFYPEVVARLGDWHRASAQQAAEQLARPGIRVLDAGAGSAVWSRSIAARAPSVSVVAVDLPAVIATTESIVGSRPEAPSYEFAALDLFEDDLEVLGSFDLVLAANLLHLFSADRASSLIRRLAGRVRPRGTLAVVDAIPTGTLDAADRSARLYGVHLLTRTSEGRPWSLREYEGWLQDAGLHDITHVSVAEDSPMSLVTGRMPT